MIAILLLALVIALALAAVRWGADTRETGDWSVRDGRW